MVPLSAAASMVGVATQTSTVEQVAIQHLASAETLDHCCQSPTSSHERGSKLTKLGPRSKLSPCSSIDIESCGVLIAILHSTVVCNFSVETYNTANPPLYRE